MIFSWLMFWNNVKTIQKGQTVPLKEEPNPFKIVHIRTKLSNHNPLDQNLEWPEQEN